MDSDKPSNVVHETEHVKKTSLVPIARHGFGTKGEKIQLFTNHFRVNLNNANGHFFQYSVSITYEDGSPVEAKGIGRKILEKVQETYQSDLGSKYFAYDGDKTLFTVGALPRTKLDFSVVLEVMVSSRRNDADMKRLKRPYQSKKFNVAISFAAKISIQAIANALQGKETNHLQDAVRVLDVILLQNAARLKYFTDIGEGVDCCKGFHSSFRTTQGGLSLNIDVSSTMIVHPGPVDRFLIANQKAKSTLKNLRVKVIPSNREYKITGLSEKICKDQTYIWKRKNENGEVTYLCINVGKPKRPTYYPVEHCVLVSLQRYTKALSPFQRSNLVKESRQKPTGENECVMLSIALKNSNYNNDPMLQESGVRISSDFTQVEGRVLPTPNVILP
ncbi:unnamed protein product [Arabis nemorensis]|uniref:PAZ domain-containing protein n=1 Tax=Arabis nemorensis TaxID=586526 RepID=A0A565BCQ4_9BRAS|nr:unnamed protein product [Arabis nemorensis]